MNENIEFLQAFLKNPGKVGAIAPSSPELAQKMIEGIAPSEKNIILELGVGTGAITKFVSEIVPDDSYLGIELDKDLVKLLKRNFPQLKIVRGNAVEAAALHRKSGLGKVGYIICCLPFVSIPNDVGEDILRQIDKFMERGDCVFRTFQYAHGYYFPSAIKLREHMRNRYGKARKSQLIMKNVPPAYTLTWKTS